MPKILTVEDVEDEKSKKRVVCLFVYVFVHAGKRVGRATKLLKPEAVQAEVDARSIAANPFPYNITMDEVETFFKEHGQVIPAASYEHNLVLLSFCETCALNV